jgi:ABC-type Fe3+-hydroxamate transport system substrate-binding protein
MKNARSQFCLFLVTGLLVAGCSTLGSTHDTASTKTSSGPVASAPPQPRPAPVRPKRSAPRETHEAKEPERVAALDPKSLIGLTPAAVEKLLGAPSAVLKSDPSLVWTYSGQGCSVQIVFYPDLKTTSYHALKYNSTAGAEADNACVRNILTVRSNGPS